MDEAIAKILEPYANSDAYTKVKALYDWVVTNVEYTHNGYSQVSGATNYYDFLTRTFYVERMTYEEGLEHAIPDKVINHAAYALFEYKGACYDYASLMAVGIRYIGINAYVHTGYWILESDGSRDNHHGWCEIELNGKLYIIDAQRDYRLANKAGSIQYYYFGIPHENGSDWRYWSPDTADNAERDALFMSVTADRVDPGSNTESNGNQIVDNSEASGETVTLVVTITGNGTVTCDSTKLAENTYQVKMGDKVTLEAVPGTNSAFRSWWDKAMREYLLATAPEYETAAQISADEGVTLFIDDNLVINEGTIVIEAVFEDTAKLSIISSTSGSVKSDGTTASSEQTHLIGDVVTLEAVPDAGKEFVGWYNEYRTLLSEETTYQLTVQKNTTIYAMFEGDYFWDVTPSDWYYDEVRQAAELGITNGIDAITFSGETPYLRVMAVVMLARAVDADLSDLAPAPFEDTKNLSYGQDEIAWAYANGAITGRTNTIFDPETAVTREEFMLIMVRYLKSIGIEADTSATELTFSDMNQATYTDAIKAAVALGLVQGDSTEAGGTVRPKATLTRAEGTAIVLRMVKLLKEETPTDE